MSNFLCEFTEKTVKKYIGSNQWQDCTLSDNYMYLEYHDEGGYGTIHKVLDKATGEHLIMKQSSKKDFVPGKLADQGTRSLRDLAPVARRATGSTPIGKAEDSPKVSREAEYLVVVHNELNGLRLNAYYDLDDSYILVMEDGGRSLEDLACSHKKKILNLLRYDAYKNNLFFNRYLKQIANYMIQVYHKVRKIHNLGIHHNDLKPENILLRPLESRNEIDVLIIDFGVAKPVEPTYTNFRGTLEYVPYEYVKSGSYKPWDHTIWCFGVMLHFLTLMTYPFVKQNDVLCYSLSRERIDKLPKPFATLIYDCLEKNPLKRPHNLLERLTELGRSAPS